MKTKELSDEFKSHSVTPEKVAEFFNIRKLHFRGIDDVYFEECAYFEEWLIRFKKANSQVRYGKEKHRNNFGVFDNASKKAFAQVMGYTEKEVADSQIEGYTGLEAVSCLFSPRSRNSLRN